MWHSCERCEDVKCGEDAPLECRKADAELRLVYWSTKVARDTEAVEAIRELAAGGTLGEVLSGLLEHAAQLTYQTRASHERILADVTHRAKYIR